MEMKYRITVEKKQEDGSWALEDEAMECTGYLMLVNQEKGFYEIIKGMNIGEAAGLIAVTKQMKHIALIGTIINLLHDGAVKKETPREIDVEALLKDLKRGEE